MVPLIVAAASKVPFYIAGGAFAVWAVVLSAIGLNSPGFPGNMGGQRLVMLVSFVLMVASIAMAVVTA